MCRRHHNLKTHAGWHLEPDLSAEHREQEATPRTGLEHDGARVEPNLFPADTAERDGHVAKPVGVATESDEAVEQRDAQPQQEAVGWTWHSPAGLRITDGPAPPF